MTYVCCADCAHDPGKYGRWCPKIRRHAGGRTRRVCLHFQGRETEVQRLQRLVDYLLSENARLTKAAEHAEQDARNWEHLAGYGCERDIRRHQ